MSTENDRNEVIQILLLYLLQSFFTSNLVFKRRSMKYDGAGETNSRDAISNDFKPL